jgi:hypothetical protein
VPYHRTDMSLFGRNCAVVTSTDGFSLGLARVRRLFLFSPDKLSTASAGKELQAGTGCLIYRSKKFVRSKVNCQPSRFSHTKNVWA